MSTEFLFNVFDVRIEEGFWERYFYFIFSGVMDKDAKSEVAKRWRDGDFIALSYYDNACVILSDNPSVGRELLRLQFSRCELCSLHPVHIITFAATVMLNSTEAVANIRESGRRFWGIKEKKKNNSVVALYPSFFGIGNERVCIDISATTFQIAGAEELLKSRQVYTQEQPGQWRSAGFRPPLAGEMVRRPERRNSRIQVEWAPSADRGPLCSKLSFLHWVVEELNATKSVTISPAKLSPTPLKSMVDWAHKSAVSKQKMANAATGWLPFDRREIHLYDRRTAVDQYAAWHDIVSALEASAKKYGLTVVDFAQSDFASLGGNPVFVAIDNEDFFSSEEEDSKPHAVASTGMSVQCFSSKIVIEDSSISEATFLLMLSNAAIKREVEQRALVMYRPWTDIASKYLFGERFVVGEDACYVGVKISEDGTMEFFVKNSFDQLYYCATDNRVTPIFKISDTNYLPNLAGAILVFSSHAKALPLRSRDGMSEHFTGIRILLDEQMYYSAGVERPAKTKVERALVLRKVQRVGIAKTDDVVRVASFCLDPCIRVGAASAWPGPFKLLREYVEQLSRGASPD